MRNASVGMVAGAVAVDVQRRLGKAGAERCRPPSPAGRRASARRPSARHGGPVTRRPAAASLGRSTVSSLRFSTTMRPPIITECTPVPSSVCTIWFDRIVHRDPVHVVQVEEDDVGLVARRDPADLLRQGRARGRRLRCAARSASSVVIQRSKVRALDLGGERGEPHRLVDVLVVRAVRAVGADADVDLARRACRARRRARCPAACWSRDCAPPRRRDRPAASCRRRRATRRAPR